MNTEETGGFIRKLRDNQELVQYLYKVPDDLDTDCKYIVISAANRPEFNLCETFVFKADLDGNILSFFELDGSTKGIVDPDQVFEDFCRSKRMKGD